MKIIGVLAALLTMFGFVPQALKMKRTKSVEDVSLITLVQFSIGVFLWMVYGFYLKDVIIITANGVTLSSLIVALFYYLRFSKEGRNLWLKK